MKWLFIELFAMVGTLQLSLLLHELAHAYIAKKKGIPVVKYQIGIGKKLFSIGKVDIMAIPLGAGVGIDVETNSTDINYQKDLIEVFSAGILMNLLLTVLSAPFLSNTFMYYMFSYNICFAIENLIPIKHFGMIPDGKRMLNALKIILVEKNNRKSVVEA